MKETQDLSFCYW